MLVYGCWQRMCAEAQRKEGLRSCFSAQQKGFAVHRSHGYTTTGTLPGHTRQAPDLCTELPNQGLSPARAGDGITLPAPTAAHPRWPPEGLGTEPCPFPRASQDISSSCFCHPSLARGGLWTGSLPCCPYLGGRAGAAAFGQGPSIPILSSHYLPMG